MMTLSEQRSPIKILGAQSKALQSTWSTVLKNCKLTLKSILISAGSLE